VVHVDPSNAEVAAAWDGPSGDFWTDHADAFDAGVAGYTEPFLAAAAIAPDAHVLDVGCGIGLTTRKRRGSPPPAASPASTRGGGAVGGIRIPTAGRPRWC
jgi:hypothetical protein